MFKISKLKVCEPLLGCAKLRLCAAQLTDLTLYGHSLFVIVGDFFLLFLLPLSHLKEQTLQFRYMLRFLPFLLLFANYY